MNRPVRAPGRPRAGPGRRAATPHLVHGLGTVPAPPDWPPLTEAELDPVLNLYPGIGGLRAIAWRSPRPFAASGLAACAHATVFVKRHHRSVRGPADLAEEHALIAQLRGAGAAVPAVLAAGDGATTVARGDRVYEVHAAAAGSDLYRDAVSWSPFAHRAHAHEAGRALARLHAAAAGYAAPPRRTGLLVADFRVFGAADPLEALQRRIAAEPLLAAALAGRPWRHDIARALLPWHGDVPRDLTPLWTHNDFHASNLLWHGEGAAASVACVLDFGLANVTTSVFDLATAIERNAIAWLRLGEGATDIADVDAALALVAGYRAVRALPSREAAALPRILPLVHAEFALSELAYFHGVLGEADKASLAYDDFLLGHADWFATRPGRALLQALSHAVS